MDMWGISKAVLLPVITKQSQTETLNLWASQCASDRIIPFGGVYAHTDDYKRDIDYISSLGIVGLKFHPEYQNFYVNDPKMFNIYDYALSKGLILLFHSGFDPAFKAPFHSSAKMYAEIEHVFGGGKVILAHLGAQEQQDEVEKYLCGTNYYFDTSMGFEHYTSDQFERIVKAHGAEKILFASDSPWSVAKDEIAALKKTSLTDMEKEMIFHINAEKLLGI